MKSSYRECQWNIVVHLGAGYHSPKLKHEYESLLKEVCEIGGKILALGGEAVEAIQACISILEDSPLTNAGRGSNLTEDGKVECDASAIQSYFPTYINLEREHLTVSGSVGCLSDFKNPIKVAVSILRESNKIDPIFGREPPIFLVGEGAKSWALKHGFSPISSPQELITEESFINWKNLMEKLQTSSNPLSNDNSTEIEFEQGTTLYDTIGAVCIDMYGNIASGISSGGILLKHSGRIGQGGHIGSGCWAENDWQTEGFPGLACCTSGIGEFLMQSMCAKDLCTTLRLMDETTEALQNVFQNLLKQSPFQKKKLFGFMGLKVEDSRLQIFWGHTTSSMLLAYYSDCQSKPISEMSYLKSRRDEGKKYQFGETFFRYKRKEK